MMSCNYCLKDIDTDEPGWGYFMDELGLCSWHVECIEIHEGIKVEA